MIGAAVDSASLGELAEQAVTLSRDGKRRSSGVTAEDVQNVYEGAFRTP